MQEGEVMDEKAMSDQEFKDLQSGIRRTTLRLEELQQMSIKQTGRRYVIGQGSASKGKGKQKGGGNGRKEM
jgi:hypothetical protein